MATPVPGLFGILESVCIRLGYRVQVEIEPRGWKIRVLDPSDSEVCHSLAGDIANLDAAALNILIYLKPIVSLEPVPDRSR